MGRLLRVVAEQRHQEFVTSGGTGRGSKGWLRTARDDLRTCGLDSFWTHTALSADSSPGDWRKVVYKAVDGVSDRDRTHRMQELPSTADYVKLKEWGVNSEDYSFSSGEVGRCGQIPGRSSQPQGN